MYVGKTVMEDEW